MKSPEAVQVTITFTLEDRGKCTGCPAYYIAPNISKCNAGHRWDVVVRPIRPKSCQANDEIQVIDEPREPDAAEIGACSEGGVCRWARLAGLDNPES